MFGGKYDELSDEEIEEIIALIKAGSLLFIENIIKNN